MKDKFNIVGVIPARYESTRLSHKLLRTIHGKSLLRWTWENATSAHSLDRLIIACDHVEIKKEAKRFGAEAVLTSIGHSSGTDRIAEVIRGIDTKIVINIQADEPLIHHSVIDRLAQEMLADSELVMATVKKRIDEDDEINNPNIVKVVTNREDIALYFSRFPIPFRRGQEYLPVHYKHLGIYAYTKDFLYTFKNLPESSLERAEKLEQLRALEAGYKIRVVETQFDSCGVDTEDDLRKAERLLSGKSKVKY